MLNQTLKYLVIVTVALFLSGCSGSASFNFERIFDSITGHGNSMQPEPARNKIDSLLANNRPIEALELMKQMEGENDRLAEFYPHLYSKALNGSLREAERLYVFGDFASAGDIYRRVVNAYPASAEIQGQIDLDKETLLRQIEQCADKLLESGMTAYRNGQLQDAISVWSQIRRFHPEYKASDQAINTTRKQLKYLESINDGPG